MCAQPASTSLDHVNSTLVLKELAGRVLRALGVICEKYGEREAKACRSQAAIPSLMLAQLLLLKEDGEN